MKKVYLPIIFVLITLMSNAQTFQVKEVEPENVIVNNDTIYLVGSPDDAQIAKHLDIENLTAEIINMNIVTEDIQMPSEMNSTFCLNVCYPPTTHDVDFDIDASSDQPLDIDLMTSGSTGVAIVKITLTNLREDEAITFYIHVTIEGNGIFESNKYELNAYPNPVTSTMNVIFNGSTNPDTKIDIYDAVGKLVTSKPVSSATNYQFNLSDLPRGIYMLKLIDNSNVIQTRKIIKN